MGKSAGSPTGLCQIAWAVSYESTDRKNSPPRRGEHGVQKNAVFLPRIDTDETRMRSAFSGPIGNRESIVARVPIEWPLNKFSSVFIRVSSVAKNSLPSTSPCTPCLVVNLNPRSNSYRIRQTRPRLFDATPLGYSEAHSHNVMFQNQLRSFTGDPC